MDYLITFTGFIDPLMRGTHLPATVADILYISTESEQGVVNAANDRLGHYIRLQGMAVSVNPNEIQTLLSARRWVPMNRISHIDIKVQIAQPPTLPPDSKAPEMGWAQ